MLQDNSNKNDKYLGINLRNTQDLQGENFLKIAWRMPTTQGNRMPYYVLDWKICHEESIFPKSTYK